MNKNLKKILIGVAVVGGAYLVYRYFFAPTEQEDALVYNKFERDVVIV